MMIFASEVPVISALNPYRKIEDVFLAVWKRTNPAQLERLRTEQALEAPTPEARMEAVVRDLGVAPAVEALVKEAAAAKTTTTVAKAQAKIASVLPAATPVAVKQEVVQFVTSEMHKTFGVQHEATAIEQYQQEERVVVKEKNLVFSKRKLAVVGGHEVFVGGKIDGKVGGKVVEVKNRLRRFITPLPPYDVAQLQTYLFILQATEGEIVEYLRSDSAATKLTPVARDDNMWQTQLSPHIVRFSSALSYLMKDEEAQADFLRAEGDGQREIIRYFWSKDLVLGDPVAS